MKNKILKIVLGIVIGIIAIVTIVFIVTKLSEKKPSDTVVSFVENLQKMFIGLWKVWKMAFSPKM